MEQRICVNTEEDRALQEDLIVFRWLERQISNKKAITACLLVLKGISDSEGPPAEAHGEER